jgi:hypothetical protein
MIYAPGARDTLGSVHQNRPEKGPLSDKLINEFAGQAVCRQESRGLMLDRAWSKT